MNKQERNEYKEALKTYGGVCAICGNHIVELHHIIYRMHGLTVRQNLIPLCKLHHMEVHTDQSYWTDVLLDMNRAHYGAIDKNDLKKKGKYSEFKFGN